MKCRDYMNGIQPRRMESHRRWLWELLETTAPLKRENGAYRVSRRRNPALYTVKFELQWDLIGFLLGQEYCEEVRGARESLHTLIRRVITLSGDEDIVQALPCAEYMGQIWPTTSADFIQLLEDIVKSPAQSHECKSFLQGRTLYLQKINANCLIPKAFSPTELKYVRRYKENPYCSKRQERSTVWPTLRNSFSGYLRLSNRQPTLLARP